MKPSSLFPGRRTGSLRAFAWPAFFLTAALIPATLLADLAPALAITEPPQSMVLADPTTPSILVIGTNHATAVGALVWTNALTGEGGVMDATPEWIINLVTLARGTNVITVTGTNAAGASATATLTVIVPGEDPGASPVHYVDPQGSSTWPYATWATAARSIQDAIEAAAPHETVWVSNGLYQAGQFSAHGVVCRVAVNKPLILRSVNGPEATVIQGDALLSPALRGTRGVYLTNGASLIGFTVRNGYAAHVYQLPRPNCAWECGGGIWCESTNATVVNCALTDNVAQQDGGGIYGGTLFNCVLRSNTAARGGGASGSVLHGATVVHNQAREQGGGAFHATLDNSIVYDNTAPEGPNYSADSVLDACCTWPEPLSGTGNFTNPPALVSPDDSHLLAGSACIDAGNNRLPLWPTDWDGEARTNGAAVDVGSDEVWPDGIAGALSVRIELPSSNVVVGTPVAFRAHFAGRVAGYAWAFGDGTSATNQWSPIHPYPSPGTYPVVLVASNLSTSAVATATVTVVSPETICYVATNGAHIYPFTSWAAAATNIQAAIDGAAIGAGGVLVSNGVYDVGTTAVRDTAPYRVAVRKPIAVRSLNGPEVTVIVGAPTLSESIRCVYLTNGASLSGFTLTQGRAWDSFRFPPAPTDWRNGGGVWCESTHAVVANCVLIGNAAQRSGGGAWGGTLINCFLHGNSALSGGGAYESVLIHCTLSENTASVRGGGVDHGWLSNCLVQANSAPTGSNHIDAVLEYCCTAPLPDSGAGNFSAAPMWLSSADPHLLAGSPCIDAGGALPGGAAEAADIDGEPRLGGARVDIGCDEFWDERITGPITVALESDTTHLAVGAPFPFHARITGRVLAYRWDFGDGTDATNVEALVHPYAAPGAYPVVLTAFNHTVSASATVTVSVASAETTYYVATNGAHAFPFTTWATAATNIQAAIDAAAIGTRGVVVSNGVYASGESSAEGGTYRVVVNKPIVVQSVNGPDVTIIKGAPSSSSGWPPSFSSGVACVCLADGASLVGFTLREGRASGLRRIPIDPGYELTNTVQLTTLLPLPRPSSRGGGVACASTNALVARCVLADNYASGAGGGAWRGTLVSSVLRGNASSIGGGAHECVLINCTVVGNEASGRAGGVSDGRVSNSIVYDNTAPEQPNFSTNTLVEFSCTFPLPAGGTGNVTNTPGIVGPQDAHLLAGSPCLDAGAAAAVAWPADLDGEPRILGAGVDIGADEYGEDLLTGPIAAAVQPPFAEAGVDVPVEFAAQISGRVQGYAWTLPGGREVPGQWKIVEAFGVPGDYEVVLTVSNRTTSLSVTGRVCVVPPGIPVEPTILCPAPITLALDDDCEATIPDLAPFVTVADNCTPVDRLVFTQVPRAGTKVSSPRRFHGLVRVEDASGNTAICYPEIVTVDVTPPSLSCPDALTVWADTNCQAAIPAVPVSVSDGCGRVRPVLPPIPNGIGLASAVSPVSAVTLVTNVPGPSDSTGLVAPGQPSYGGFYPGYGNSTSAWIFVTQDPLPGAVVGVGVHLITVTAIDLATNSTQRTVALTVLDPTPPGMVCPPDLSLEFENEAGAVATFSIGTSNTCSVVARTTPPSGSVFPIGTNRVVARAQNAAGQEAQCTFTVTILGAHSVLKNVWIDVGALASSNALAKVDRERLGQARTHLAALLAAEFWLDETHLQRRGGDEVFNQGRDAVQAFQDLLKNKRSEIPDARVEGLAQRIVKSERLLAAVEIQDASHAGVAPKKLREAQAELAKGDEAAGGGKPGPAIEHYQHAWKRALTVRIKALHDPGASPRLVLVGLPGVTYAIQASSNLVDWITVGTATADADGIVRFTEPAGASTPRRFYRVMEP